MQEGIWREPVRWINLQGKDEANPHVPRHPLVQVELSAQEHGQKLQGLALVDTGATQTLLEPSLLAVIGAESNGEKELSGNWSVSTYPTYPVWIRVLGCPILTIKTEASTLSVVSENYTPRIVLGMDALRYGRLVLDPTEQSFLEFRHAQLAKLLETAPLKTDPHPGG